MRWLRPIILAVLLTAAAPAWADEIAPQDHAAIVQVIRDQMAAFRRDDAAGAFGFASPGIQGMFGTADRFLDMVRQAYQPVYRPRSAEFGPTETVEGKVVQSVEIEGPDGRRQTAIYTMERQPDGSWRISGCVLTDSGSVGA